MALREMATGASFGAASVPESTTAVPVPKAE